MTFWDALRTVHDTPRLSGERVRPLRTLRSSTPWTLQGPPAGRREPPGAAALAADAARRALRAARGAPPRAGAALRCAQAPAALRRCGGSCNVTLSQGDPSRPKRPARTRNSFSTPGALTQSSTPKHPHIVAGRRGDAGVTAWMLRYTWGGTRMHGFSKLFPVGASAAPAQGSPDAPGTPGSSRSSDDGGWRTPS